LTFKRLNLGAAITALMPTDDYGSTTATAHNLGSLSGSRDVSGVISTLGDVDYLKFTATAGGTISFAASNMTHQMDVAWTLAGSTGTLSNNGDTFTFNVVAGQTYTVGVSSTGGLGYYDLEISSESQFSYSDWGAVAFAQLNNLAVNGEAWYRVQASQAGYLTVESLFGTTSGQVNLQLYNSSMQLVDSGNAANGTSRVDTYATTGQEFFICVLGNNSDVDYRLSNLVSVSGTIVNVAGTSGNDAFMFTAGSSTHSLTVNGVTHDFSSMAVNAFNVNGGSGTDSITYTGSAAVEAATLSVGQLSVTSSSLTTQAASVEKIIVNGSSNDVAHLYDSAGSDRYYSSPIYASMSGTSFDNQVYGIATTYGYASTGDDRASLYDSAGDDYFYAWSDKAQLKGAGYLSEVRNFDRVTALGSTGDDRASLYGTDGDDLFHAKSDHSRLQGANYYNYAQNFDRVYAHANGGSNDRAYFYGTDADDLYHGMSDHSRLQGNGYYDYAVGFDKNYAQGYGGHDRAYLYGSSSNDQYFGSLGQGELISNSYYNLVQNFEMISARGTIGLVSQASSKMGIFNQMSLNTLKSAPQRLAVIEVPQTNTLNQSLPKQQDAADDTVSTPPSAETRLSEMLTEGKKKSLVPSAEFQLGAEESENENNILALDGLYTAIGRML
jgi:hypothetical protein